MCQKKRLIPVVLSILLALFFLKLYQVYNEHFASFGCFDECYNYVSGYFILKGRQLYSQIYFNHQMLMAYISALLQVILHPQSIYFLVLEHRLFVFFFGVLFDLLLIARFGLPAVGFAVVFEATKFYFMGSLFIAESLLVYPLVYLWALAWQKILKKRIFAFDYVLSGIFTWFVIFLREPAVLAPIFLYGLILWGKAVTRVKWLSILIFVSLTMITLLSVSLPDYINQVFVYNAQTIFLTEIGSQALLGLGILKVFFYPIFILTGSANWNFVREILIVLDIVFLISFLNFAIKRKKIKVALIFLFILGLANFRVVTPGKMFYEAFHILPWYGLFIFFTFLLLRELFIPQTKKILKYPLLIIIILVSFYAVLSPKSFLWEKIDRDREFRLGFDKYYIYGEAIRQLAKATDTLYLEGWDELIYWQADLSSSYEYSRNLGVDRAEFTNARIEMFLNNPPDFYYTPCSLDKRYFGFLPEFRIGDYLELFYVDKPSCLLVKKSKISQISPKQWENANVLRFYLPKLTDL